MTKATTRSAPAPGVVTLKLVEAKGLADRIAERLIAMIQTGELKPGERLVQTDLAGQFGVSRVAIRDALHRLRQTGLAVEVPRKGMVVRSVSCKMVRDLFAVRRAVEGLATRLACGQHSPESLAGLGVILRDQEKLARRPDLGRVIEKDWQFHQALYARAHNAPLEEIIANLWTQMRQARSLASADPGWGKGWAARSIDRHRRILEALGRRDGVEAERLVVEAIDRAEGELVRGLEEAGWGEEAATGE